MTQRHRSSRRFVTDLLEGLGAVERCGQLRLRREVLHGRRLEVRRQLLRLGARRAGVVLGPIQATKHTTEPIPRSSNTKQATQQPHSGAAETRLIG